MAKPSVKAYILWIFQKIKRRFPLILALTFFSIVVSFSGICFVFFTKELVNGAGLSEGQAQRISLARAILSGAPVLLLDEVTSALDAVTEKIVLERICALPGKTCIAVTHRPAALKLANRIIEVSEEGMTLKTCE